MTDTLREQVFFHDITPVVHLSLKVSDTRPTSA